MLNISPELAAAFADDSLANWEISERFPLPYDTIVRERRKWRKQEGLPPQKKGRKPASRDYEGIEGLDTEELFRDFRDDSMSIGDIFDKYAHLSHKITWNWVQQRRKPYRESIGLPKRSQSYAQRVRGSYKVPDDKSAHVWVHDSQPDLTEQLNRIEQKLDTILEWIQNSEQ